MIGFVFILLYGCFKSLSDLSAEGRIFSKAESSNNKWLVNEKGELIAEPKRHWYYAFIYNPEHKERFPYSSTFLVSLTDFWHKTESLRAISVIACAQFYTTFHSQVVDTAIMFTCYMVGFTSVYEPIKRNLFNIKTRIKTLED